MHYWEANAQNQGNTHISQPANPPASQPASQPTSKATNQPATKMARDRSGIRNVDFVNELYTVGVVFEAPPNQPVNQPVNQPDHVLYIHVSLVKCSSEDWVGHMSNVEFAFRDEVVSLSKGRATISPESEQEEWEEED